MSKDEQAELLRVIRGLMLADNLGDVHDEINRLCRLAGVREPSGNYLDGWTKADWRAVSGQEDTGVR